MLYEYSNKLLRVFLRLHQDSYWPIANIIKVIVRMYLSDQAVVERSELLNEVVYSVVGIKP